MQNTARSGKQKDFSMVPSASIERSVFDRSHAHKTTFDVAKIVPVFVDEALPGDTFHLSTSALCRLSTPIVPIMDDLKMDIHYFAVPYRLVWENFQAFMGERKNPDDSVDFLIPEMSSGTTGWPTGSVQDYLGLPTNVPNLRASSLFIRAYYRIWNEWYRDQNLQTSNEIGGLTDDVLIDQDVTPAELVVRNKRHDYFTSCLPWPQKGPGVELPLGVPNIVYSNRQFTLQAVGEAGSPGSHLNMDGNGAWYGNVAGVGPGVAVGVKDLGIDLEPASALTINTMRQAFQIQKMLERDARGGSRYIEIIKSHFGVTSPDARLQRPEYLGKSSFDVNINPVLQNSATTETSPQGNLAAYGVAGGVGGGFNHSFVEHCIVLGLASVRSNLTYQQGINRMFSRKTRFDFFWPAMAHLGEQAVLNSEIYAQGTEADEQAFGYQERYAEYRYKPSVITGKMRSTDPQSLDVWHLAQHFTELPTLTEAFIQENPPITRALAVTDEPHFIADFYFKLKCIRPLPTYSVPGYIDHF